MDKEVGHGKSLGKALSKLGTKLVGATIRIQLHNGHWWSSDIVGFDAENQHHWCVSCALLKFESLYARCEDAHSMSGDSG